MAQQRALMIGASSGIGLGPVRLCAKQGIELSIRADADLGRRNMMANW